MQRHNRKRTDRQIDWQLGRHGTGDTHLNGTGIIIIDYIIRICQ